MFWLVWLACTKADDSDTGVVATANVEFRLANVSAAGDLHASDGDHDIKLAPGAVIVHDDAFVLFEEGQKIPFPSLEPLAEDGNPAALQAALDGVAGVFDVQFIAAVDSVTYDEAPILPGESGVLRLVLAAGQRVTFASMYGESNDALLAGGGDVVVGEDGSLILDDFTSDLSLYDMGTEVNQEPGVGPDQAPRQAAPDTGTSEDNPVTRIGSTDGSGFTYPAVTAFAALTASIVVE